MNGNNDCLVVQWQRKYNDITVGLGRRWVVPETGDRRQETRVGQCRLH